MVVGECNLFSVFFEDKFFFVVWVFWLIIWWDDDVVEVKELVVFEVFECVLEILIVVVIFELLL